MSSMPHTQQKQHQGTTSTQRPWEKVGADLFEIYNKHYLILVDYYFRFIEIEIQCETTSDKVIECCKSQFAHYGIPDVVISDNSPQFSSKLFRDFTNIYQFQHITSSPHSNGSAEKAVQTIKSLIKKHFMTNKTYIWILGTPP